MKPNFLVMWRIAITVIAVVAFLSNGILRMEFKKLGAYIDASDIKQVKAGVAEAQLNVVAADSTLMHVQYFLDAITKNGYTKYRKETGLNWREK